MADENVNVEFTVTAPGLAKLEKALQAIRQEMQDLGMDMKPVEKSLGAAETQIVKIKKSADGAAKSTEGAAKSARGWAETMSTVWKRQFQEGEKLITQADRIAKAQEDAARKAATTKIAKNAPRQAADQNAHTNWNSAFQSLTTNSNNRSAAAEAKAVAKAEREAADAIRATEQAQLRAEQATQKRARAESELQRARKLSGNKTANAEFDVMFKEAEASAKASAALAKSQQDVSDPSTRYALYDVANAFKLIGVAMAGAATYAVIVGTRFQTAFSNVERTMDVAGRSTSEFAQAADQVRSSLVQLTGQIPLTFDQVTEIATLGNQMGISEDAVVDFTGTIARFAAVSGVSIDEVTKAFGGFAAQTNLDPKYFENLSSAISLVGVRSNATEAQILSLVREVSATAATAGFAADEIIGLAGTFATLQVAPERARGVLDTYFATLNKALARGGEKLDAFTRITGRTASELRGLVSSGQGAQVFQEVIEGLANASSDPVALTRNLDTLGLSGLRAGNTFTRLSENLEDARASMANAEEGFRSGGETQRQYAVTMQNLSAQWQIFINGLNGLIATVSGGAVPGLAKMFEIINSIIFGMIEWLGDNKWAVALGVIATAIIGVSGAMLLFRGLLTAATATVYAAQTAITRLGGASLATAGTVRGLAGALFGLGQGARGAAVGVNVLKFSIKALLAGTGVGLLLLLIGGLAEGFMGSGDAASDAALSNAEFEEAMRGIEDVAPDAASATEGLGGALDKTGGSAEKAAKKVRTLVDYANDLTGVFNRSKDLRFGAQEAMDKITLKWIEMNEQVRDYQSQIRTLTADRALKQYWLGIAVAYDDQVRAAQLREEIAQTDEKIAAAQSGASTELQGNSKEAIRNRQAMRELLGSYDAYISALASAGVGQKQIQEIIGRLNANFGAQAEQIGYSRGELKQYSDRFVDLRKVVQKVPRDVTVKFDADPALLALKEFFAKAEKNARDGGERVGGGFGGGVNKGIKKALEKDKPKITGGYQDLIDGINENSKKGGEKAGSSFTSEFGKFWKDPVGNVDNAISDFTTRAYEKFKESGKKSGSIFAGSSVQSVQAGLSASPNIFSGWIPAQEENASRAGDRIGRKGGGGIFSGVLAGLSGKDPITPWANRLNIDSIGRGIGDGTAGGVVSGAGSGLRDRANPLIPWANRLNAYGVGTGIGNSIYGGLVDKLNQKLSASVFKTSNNPRVGLGTVLRGGAMGGFFPGYSDGGYTGPGHWLKPAGFVHAGEYVIPKRYVDQRSGLPDIDYVASLQRSRPSNKAGYATGGLVGAGGSGIPGTIELGPASLNYLSHALRVRLNVGGRELASASSRGDASLAWAGSN